MISVLAIALLGQITLKEEGVNLGVVNSINCTGSGVYCARTGTSGTLVVLGQVGDGGSSGAASTVTVDGGYLAVSNFPASYACTVPVNPVADGGMVNVGNWPASFPGAVTVPINPVADGGMVNIGNWPASFPGAVTVPINPVADGGMVNVGNWPASFPGAVTIPINPVADGGMVNVGNWPASFPGAVTIPINPVADGGMVNVGNFPVPPFPLLDGGMVNIGNTVTVGTHGVTLAAASITGSNPCQNPTATVLGASVATSGTASVQLVALSGTTKIYICSLNVTGVSGTTPKISITYGTGSACASGTVTLVGPVTTTANVNLYMGPMFAVTPAGQALCYVQTGTTPISNLNLTYVQQ